VAKEAQACSLDERKPVNFDQLNASSLRNIFKNDPILSNVLDGFLKNH